MSLSLYDLTEEQKNGFPKRDSKDPVIQTELRWIYYSLANFDGTPDLHLIN